MDAFLDLFDSALTTGSWSALSEVNTELSQFSRGQLESCLSFLELKRPIWKESLGSSYTVLASNLLARLDFKSQEQKESSVNWLLKNHAKSVCELIEIIRKFNQKSLTPAWKLLKSKKVHDSKFTFKIAVERFVLYGRLNVEQQAIWKWNLKTKKFKLMDKLKKLKKVFLKKFYRDKQESLYLWRLSMQEGKSNNKPMRNLVWAILLQLVRNKCSNFKLRYLLIWHIRASYKSIDGLKQEKDNEVLKKFKRVCDRASFYYKLLVKNGFAAWKDVDFVFLSNLTRRSDNSVFLVRNSDPKFLQNHSDLIRYICLQHENKKNLPKQALWIWKNSAGYSEKLKALGSMTHKIDNIYYRKNKCFFVWKHVVLTENICKIKISEDQTVDKAFHMKSKATMKILAISDNSNLRTLSKALKIWTFNALKEQFLQNHMKMNSLVSYMKSINELKSSLKAKYLMAMSQLFQQTKYKKLSQIINKSNQKIYYCSKKSLDQWKEVRKIAQAKTVLTFTSLFKPILDIEMNYKCTIRNFYRISSKETDSTSNDRSKYIKDYTENTTRAKELKNSQSMNEYSKKRNIRRNNSSFAETDDNYLFDDKYYEILYFPVKKPLCMLYEYKQEFTKEITMKGSRNRINKKKRTKARSKRAAKPCLKEYYPMKKPIMPILFDKQTTQTREEVVEVSYYPVKAQAKESKEVFYQTGSSKNNTSAKSISVSDLSDKKDLSFSPAKYTLFPAGGGSVAIKEFEAQQKIICVPVTYMKSKSKALSCSFPLNTSSHELLESSPRIPYVRDSIRTKEMLGHLQFGSTVPYEIPEEHKSLNQIVKPVHNPKYMRLSMFKPTKSLRLKQNTCDLDLDLGINKIPEDLTKTTFDRYEYRLSLDTNTRFITIKKFEANDRMIVKPIFFSSDIQSDHLNARNLSLIASALERYANRDAFIKIKTAILGSNRGNSKKKRNNRSNLVRQT